MSGEQLGPPEELLEQLEVWPGLEVHQS